MIDPSITELMQKDWNERAQEDANFYVAFGRRDQDMEEFFSTAIEVIRGLEWELKRIPTKNPRARRALEIGCGPGRLMRPMSRHFGEIHGIDVSDEMIRRACENLQGIPHAHLHHTSGCDLAPFADESFDFIYSYAVFQHIPSFDVVMNYLREAHRVLKPGGLLRVQINGLPQTAKVYDTWSGVRISAAQVREFSREHKMQLLALEGVDTQYMWTTMLKAQRCESHGPVRIRRITNAHSSEPVAPTRGVYSSITLWMENFPRACDLNNLRVTLGGREAFACYIGPRETDGLQQLNVMLPPMSETGLLPITLEGNGAALCPPSTIRVIPPGPQVPRVIALSDGINLMSGTRIVTRIIKATIEETGDPSTFQAWIDGQPVKNIDIFCADPLPPRYEINFEPPDGIDPGTYQLVMQLQNRRLAPISIEIT
jgi:ubiquinone/menaquinone biosynthesis C-methylase UbiE